MPEGLKYAYYSDATYEYHCYAAPGTELTEASWSIMRETAATGNTVYPLVAGKRPTGYNFVAADYASIVFFGD